MAGQIDTPHGVAPNVSQSKAPGSLPFPGLPLHGGFAPAPFTDATGRPYDEVLSPVPGQATQGVPTQKF